MGIESLTQFTDVPAVRHTFPIDEPPVPYSPVVILGETDDIIAVNKPASLPVHPCGAYRYNSLETILRKENKLSEFYFIHRAFYCTVPIGQILLSYVQDTSQSIIYLLAVYVHLEDNRLLYNQLLNESYILAL